MSRVNIKSITRCDGNDRSVYHRHMDQFNPCNVYLTLSQHGYVDFSIRYNNSIEFEWLYETVLTWPISPHLRDDQLVKLVKSILPLMQKVHNGHTIDYDQNNCNYVGRLTKKARAAFDDVTTSIEQFQFNSNLVGPWSYDDWCEDPNIDVLWPEGMNLQEASKILRDHFDKNDIYCNYSMAYVLLEDAEDSFRAKRKLHKFQLMELARRNRITKDEFELYQKVYREFKISDFWKPVPEAEIGEK